MKNLLTFLCVLSIWVLVSCKGHRVDEYKSRFRIMNASSLAGDINVAMDYKLMYASNIQYLNYSLFSEHISTRHILQVKNATGTILVDTALNMDYNKSYTAFLYDSSGTIRYKLIEENFVKAVGSYCKLRFLHLSNNAPATDVTAGTDTSILFKNYKNGDMSEYTLFGIDSMYFNARPAGSTTPYYVQPLYLKFKPGYFYTLYLKGNVGSLAIDSLGFFMVENSGNY